MRPDTEAVCPSGLIVHDSGGRGRSGPEIVTMDQNNKISGSHFNNRKILTCAYFVIRVGIAREKPQLIHSGDR